MADDPKPGPVRLRIASERCLGHQRCASVAPQVYRLNADGFIATVDGVADAALAPLARRGARACPEGVITIEAADD
jgi:ferredoxin